MATVSLQLISYFVEYDPMGLLRRGIDHLQDDFML